MIKVNNLVKHFPVVTGLRSLFSSDRDKQVRAVDGISFEVGAGEVLGIVGESGCGKSTVAKMLVGLETPTSGTIHIDGQDAFELRSRDRRAFYQNVQMIFQDPYGSINPSHNVFEIVSRPLFYQGHKDVAENYRRVLDVMSRVGLNPPDLFINKHPHLLSGGQRQRLCIARAVILDPRFLVADEPISMLDVSIKWDIIRLLRDLVKQHELSLVYITHDLATVSTVCDKLAIMYLGKIVETGPVRQILKNPVHPYTRALIASIPSPVPGATRKPASIRGALPDAITEFSGCKFHDRCPEAIPRCKQSEPRLAGEGAVLTACHLVDGNGRKKSVPAEGV